MGYRTRVSPEGPDGGIDIIAHKDERGFEPPIIKVQVKSGENTSVGDPVVSALYGKVGHGEFGMIVTLDTFSTPATNFAKSKSNLKLIDGAELVDLILAHYEAFDSSYKGLLPLRRVYIPERWDRKGKNIAMPQFKIVTVQECDPAAWLACWAAKYDDSAGFEEEEYKQLIVVSKQQSVPARYFERIGRWKDSANTTGRWKPNVASVAYLIWLQRRPSSRTAQRTNKH